MSQYNGTISTGQSTEASSSRIYIECFHTQITSKCPILYKHRMNHSGEFKAISSVYRKTREFKTDVCVLQSLLSGRVDHSPQSSGHFTTGQSYRKHIKFLSFLPQLKVEMGFGSSCIQGVQGSMRFLLYNSFKLHLGESIPDLVISLLPINLNLMTMVNSRGCRFLGIFLYIDRD